MPTDRDPEPPEKARVLTPLVVVVLAAALLRVMYLWAHASSLPFIDQPVLDAAWYDLTARNMLSGGLFPDGPFYHAPGYPWFLAVVYRVLGPDPRHAVIVQALLGVGTTLTAILIARRLFGREEALLTGLLLLGSGTLYFYESKLLVETWALFLLTLSVLLSLVADRELAVAINRQEREAADRAAGEGRKPPPASRGARIAAAGAGLAAGAASVARPNLLLIPVVLAVLLIARAMGRRRPWSTTWLYALGLATALLPTAIHNLSHGALAPVATNGGVNFFAGNHRGARGIYEDPPGFSGIIAAQEREADSLVTLDLGHPLPPGPESGYWTARGLAEITADIPGWLGLVARKAWLFVNRQEEEVNGSYGLEASRVPWLRIAAIPFNFFVAAGAIGLVLAAGFFGAARGARGSLQPLVLVVAAVFVTALLFFVMARLRLAVLPMLAVLSAHALARTDRAFRSGRRREIVAGLAAGVVFLALTWNSPLGPARDAAWESHLFLETGRGLQASGKTDAAARSYVESARINPKNPDPLVYLGQMALERRDLASAIQFFERARDAAPESFRVRNNLGILYYSAQRFDAVEREMEAATRLMPDQAGPFFYRGLVARENDDPVRAGQYFREALDRDPHFTGAYVRLIETCLDRGDLEQARAWANRAGERAVALPPDLAARLR